MSYSLPVPVPVVSGCDSVASRSVSAAPTTHASQSCDGAANDPFAVPHNHSDTNLFFRRLPTTIDDVELRKMFEAFGAVISAAIMRDIHTGESLGTAFVRFEEHEAALAAMKQYHHQLLGSRHLIVQWAKKQHDEAIVGEARKKVRKLFVRNIPQGVTEEMLEELMAPFGPIERVTLHVDTAPPVGSGANGAGNRGRHAGARHGAATSRAGEDPTKPVEDRWIAFITFTEDNCAANACDAVHNTSPFENCKGIPLMAKLAEDNRQRSARRGSGGASGLNHHSNSLHRAVHHHNQQQQHSNSMSTRFGNSSGASYFGECMSYGSPSQPTADGGMMPMYMQPPSQQQSQQSGPLFTDVPKLAGGNPYGSVPSHPQGQMPPPPPPPHSSSSSQHSMMMMSAGSHGAMGGMGGAGSHAPMYGSQMPHHQHHHGNHMGPMMMPPQHQMQPAYYDPQQQLPQDMAGASSSTYSGAMASLPPFQDADDTAMAGYGEGVDGQPCSASGTSGGAQRPPSPSLLSSTALPGAMRSGESAVSRAHVHHHHHHYHCRPPQAAAMSGAGSCYQGPKSFANSTSGSYTPMANSPSKGTSPAGSPGMPYPVPVMAQSSIPGYPADCSLTGRYQADLSEHAQSVSEEYSPARSTMSYGSSVPSVSPLPRHVVPYGAAPQQRQQQQQSSDAVSGSVGEAGASTTAHYYNSVQSKHLSTETASLSPVKASRQESGMSGRDSPSSSMTRYRHNPYNPVEPRQEVF